MNFNDTDASLKAQHRPKGQLGGLLARGGKLEQEDDEGAVEYKWRLTSIAPQRFEHLVTQMKFRVAEGCGQCVYELGVDDDGDPRGLCLADFEESLDTLRRMAERLGYELSVLHERTVATVPEVLKCAELHVTKYANETQELRIAMCGAADAGKSTLVGVLAHGFFDDGHGSARQSVFTHKHELDTGRTSAVAERVIGFDSVGNITNYDATRRREAIDSFSQGMDLNTATCLTETIAERSVKLVTLMDLAGHEKYSKTTLMGFTSKPPGYACIVGSFVQPINILRRTIELCHSMRVRYFIVLNKTDCVTQTQREAYLKDVADLLVPFNMAVTPVNDEQSTEELALELREVKFPSGTNSPPPVAMNSPTCHQLEETTTEPAGNERYCSADDFMFNEDAAPPAAFPTHISSSSTQCKAVSADPAAPGAKGTSPTNSNKSFDDASPATPAPRVPLFCVSCVRGDSLPLVNRFLHFLPMTESLAHLDPEVLVDQCFRHKKVGLIFSGFITKGAIKPNQSLVIGPDRRGSFFPVTLSSIHVNGANVRKASAGTEATFTFHEKLPRALVPTRKGINLLAPRYAGGQTVCMEFEAEVVVQQTKNGTGDVAVQVGHEPICHCRNIRQAVKVLSIDREELRNGQAGVIKFRFLYHPEVIDIDGVLVCTISSGRIVGTVISAQPLSPATTSAPSPHMFPCVEFDEMEDGGAAASPTELLPPLLPEEDEDTLWGP